MERHKIQVLYLITKLSVVLFNIDQPIELIGVSIVSHQSNGIIRFEVLVEDYLDGPSDSLLNISIFSSFIFFDVRINQNYNFFMFMFVLL